MFNARYLVKLTQKCNLIIKMITLLLPVITLTKETRAIRTVCERFSTSESI